MQPDRNEIRDIKLFATDCSGLLPQCYCPSRGLAAGGAPPARSTAPLERTLLFADIVSHVDFLFCFGQ